VDIASFHQNALWGVQPKCIISYINQKPWHKLASTLGDMNIQLLYNLFERTNKLHMIYKEKIQKFIHHHTFYHCHVNYS
jgi:hypothetical protein